MKRPIMLYLTEEELLKLHALVAGSPARLWEDSADDGPFEQLNVHVTRLATEAARP